MAYRIVELPGIKKYEEHRSYWSGAYFRGIRMMGQPDEPIVIEALFRNINKSVDEDLPAPHYFKLVFDNVLEYRFVASCVYYEDLSPHEPDFEFGVIEILDSEYIGNLIAKGGHGDCPLGQRLGRGDARGMDERKVRHFRMAFDEWGKLDILTFNFSIETPASA